MIYEQLELRITNEAYSFTPLITPNEKVVDLIETLTIYRDSGQVQLNAPPLQNMRIENEFVVYGIMGFISLQAGEYMVVITGCQKVGNLAGGDIYRALTFEILPITRTNGVKDDEQTYLHLLEKHLKHNTFYFSYTYNITLSLQKQLESPGSNWRNADTRFFWNRYLSEKLIDATVNSKTNQDLSSFILPVIQGFVSISSTVINHRAITFALISRRSTERAGTRFFSRGLDSAGCASNFVETEQVLLCDPAKSLVQTNLIRLSYVQTRGSVPAIWGQTPNTRYTPTLWVDGNSLDAGQAHFEQQKKIYGSQILVNLTNTKGYEAPVGQAFANIVKELNDQHLKYIHFDFHLECKKMRWHRVQLLVDQLEPDLRKQGYCHYDASNNNIQKKQASVVRTNCMDCLDRTNVVQSTLGRWVLNRQLRELGILQSTEVIENDEGFMQIFKNCWADNADSLSIPYSGTPALKTDFTRTGKRTRMGMVNDFNHSAIRYIKNNYLDGSRQDAIDLFLGKYRVSKSNHPFRNNGSTWLIKLVPLYLVLALVIFLVVLFAPELFTIKSSLMQISSLSFTFAVFVTCWLFIQQNGSEFVDWPKLLPYAQHRNEEEPHAVLKKATDMIQQWTHRRNSTAILIEAEQGYELPKLKKKS